MTWMAEQRECNLYVQIVHALWISGRSVAILRAIHRAIQLMVIGAKIDGQSDKIRLRIDQVARAFGRALRYQFTSGSASSETSYLPLKGRSLKVQWTRPTTNHL
jgi:hypothetical protein